MFHGLYKAELELIDFHLRSVVRAYAHTGIDELEKFYESLTYSLLSNGKRFRPLLSLLTAKALAKPIQVALPMAAAVELIHTYSLIHDDLPCMDNDDLRRGQLTNHKMFGETMALLAGDGLLTLAFGVLTSSQSKETARAVMLLCEAAGPRGMVGGQALDIQANKPDLDLLKEIHARKTGRLIRVAVEGAAVLCGASEPEVEALASFGAELGLAFQLADDLEDFVPEKPEKVNFASTLGIAETTRHLEEASQDALAALAMFSSSADGLRELVRLNRERV